MVRFALSLLWLILVPSAALAGSEYSVRNLLPNHAAYPIAVSSNGVILGQDTTGAFTLDQRGGFHYRAGLPGYSGSNGSSEVPVAVCVAMNKNGEIVGWHSNATTKWLPRAFISYPNGTWLDLGTLGGHKSQATAINDDSEVVGWATINPSDSPFHAFSWKARGESPWDGRLRDESLGATQDARAYGINSSGQFVGHTDVNDGYVIFRPPCVWSGAVDGEVNVLIKKTYADASRINDRGHVVGYTDSEAGFHWAPETGVSYIKRKGFSYCVANSLNNKDEAVGGCEEGSTYKAFYWSRSAGVLDLNTLIPSSAGVSLQFAISIDDRGVIVAAGVQTLSGQPGIYMLTPTKKAAPL